MSIATKHSMDIPHVTSVELPLIVKNESRAIGMLGGKEKISRVITSKYRSSDGYLAKGKNDGEKESDKAGEGPGGRDNGAVGAGGSNGNGAAGIKGRIKSRKATPSIPSITPSNTENVLELRLRNDPFHHPVPSSLNTTEKILLKVSIPKETIPKDFYNDPSKYSIRELIANNSELNGPSHKVQPVAIIDNTYLFKSMADFQVSTKRNETAQDFQTHILQNQGNFEHIKQYFDDNENFQGISDYSKAENFENRDHHLPPPPLFLPINFPFDYKYQKNPLTSTMRDETSGEIKMISKKSTIKLHTIIIDFNTVGTPMKPAAPLIEKLAQLNNPTTKPSVNSIDYSLAKCIEWLQTMFDKKPIWTRKHLEDIVPKDLKRVIKQALPFVSYIYKSGPWRFCNVKFGSNPKEDKLYWKYQSEYFRIPGLRFNKQINGDIEKTIPPTLRTRNDTSGEGEEDVIMEDASDAISLNLFFDGVRLPRTITYQVGDLLDVDIQRLLTTGQKEMGDQFFREKPDFQDGWINKQTMECIRRIIRYKLIRLVKEEKFDQEKIDKIINTDYTKGVEEEEEEVEEEEEEEGEIEADADDDRDGEADDDDEDDEAIIAGEEGFDEESVLNRLKNVVDENISNGLSGLVGFIKQDLME